MRIYTRTGDEGETGLFGGRRVAKDHRRVQAYGEVDELNAWLGLAMARLGTVPLTEALKTIQGDLLTVGADLASPPDAKPAPTRLADDRIAGLEALIDDYDDALPPLKSFILPGGTEAAATLQVCRTICRRAERSVVLLGREEEVTPAVLVYLNRLSDLLFVLARHVNHEAGVEEPKWEP